MYIHYFFNYSILKTYLLFIQPICRFVGIYFILRVIIQYCVTFLLTNIPALAIESSFRLAPMSLCAHHCSVVLFCFQAPLLYFIFCSRLILHIACLSFRFWNFSKDSWFLELQNSSGKMVTWCWACSLLLRFHWFEACSWDRTRKFMYIY